MAEDRTVEKFIEIVASAEDVWRVLTEPERIAEWMLGARAESTWEPGATITWSGELHGHIYQDCGTVLAAEPGRLLHYSHWSDFAALPDIPKNRTLVTLRLEPVGDATRLSVLHEQFFSHESFGHARFFWGYALRDVKGIVEREVQARESGAGKVPA